MQQGAGGTRVEARLETVRRGFAAFAENDFGVLRDICHPWLDFRDEMGQLMGVESVRAYMEDWFTHMRDFRAELRDASEVGDALVADVHQTAHLREGDALVEARFTHVFAWSDELIGTWHIYAERKRALSFADTLTPASRREP